MNQTHTNNHLEANKHLITALDRWMKKYNTSPKCSLEDIKEVHSLSIKWTDLSQNPIERDVFITKLKEWAAANAGIVVITPLVITIFVGSIYLVKSLIPLIDSIAGAIIIDESQNRDALIEITPGVYYVDEPNIKTDFSLPSSPWIENSIKNSINRIVDEYMQAKDKGEELLSEESRESAEVEPTEPVELTNAEKIIIILDKYDITYKQFKEIVATVLLEGGRTIIKDAEGNIIEVEITHYDECYNITSTMFNRICSISCIRFVDSRLGPGTGINIYNQVICPGQYTVSRSEVKRLADTDLSIYAESQAVIDMLYSSNPSTDFYRFYSYKRQDLHARYNGVQLSPPYGNCYHTELQDYDRVDPADTLPNYGKYVTAEESTIQEGMSAEEGKKTFTLMPTENLTDNS